jgi:parvulin-like peptidyl-prolyl isomerase
MRAIARSALLALSAAAVVAFPALGLAQVPPARLQVETQQVKKAEDPNPAPAVRPAVLNQVLATVNNETVTRGELVNFLSRYQIPAGDEATAYKDAVDTLINTKLINQYLTRQRLPVSPEQVNQAIETLKKQLAENGSDLATELLRTGMSMKDVEREYANRIRWVEFLNQRATDPVLKQYAAGHKDLFNGTQVKASHILLKVEPSATPAQKEATRQKLLGIKNEIATGKTSFAAAANKYSEDPANSEGAGGDVGYFGLNSGFIEEFAKAAFALKKSDVSEPVETPYGWHLIQVTDRKDGKEIDFEQNKPFVKQMYAAELQKQVLQAQRKDAKIDLKPMPNDLFTSPAPQPAATPAPAATPKAATPK